MKIKIKLLNSLCEPEVHGNLIDVKSAKNIVFHPPLINNTELLSIEYHQELVPVGIVVKLPKYYRANLYTRSSLTSKKGFLNPSGTGIIDGDCEYTQNIKGIKKQPKANKGYNGENDIWHINLVALKETSVEIGERIGQFEIVPTMDAPWWIKLKNFFSNKIKIEFVDIMNNPNRGGFGSSN